MWNFFKNIVFGNREIDNNKFCYVVGSFAHTAPNFRTPKSDIDVLSSVDFDNYEIEYLIKQKYPDIPSNTKIDIHYAKPDPSNKKVTHRICYWQEKKYISLINNPSITLHIILDDKDLPSVIRNPNVTELIKYLNDPASIEIKLHTSIHIYRSIKRHYKKNNYISVVDKSNMDLANKNILKTFVNKPNIVAFVFFLKKTLSIFKMIY